MKFDKIHTESRTAVKAGDILSINSKAYEVVGYTDQGQSLLIKQIGTYKLYKLVQKESK